MELPNHLLPWDTVKKLLKGAWADGFYAAIIHTDEHGVLKHIPENPYQEDE